MRIEAQSFRLLLCRRLRSNSTLLATIPQRAKWQGSWGDVGSSFF